MKITDLFEGYHDEEHSQAMADTGFWGKAAAGCIFLARDTGRLLLCHRSEDVLQPGTWGGWGGAIDRGENPEEAVQREAYEETGHTGPFELTPLFVFSNGDFRYYNYLVTVDEEFSPHLDWESQGSRWCEYGQWPSPVHFGLTSLFNDAASVQKIKAAIMACKQAE